MRNLKVTIAYRGTKYHGFQRQSNAVTVQEVLEKALSKVLNEPVTITGCSRTDTGVHANMFCFNVKTNSRIYCLGFCRGVNGELPDDISILSCEDVPEDFHARFDCKGKEYIYKIHCSESKNPFAADLMLHYRRKFDIEAARSVLIRSIEVNQMMKVVGEEGTSNDDYIIYQKGELLDAVYLQQNSFDPIDAACVPERQQREFARLYDAMMQTYDIPDKRDIRAFFNQLRQEFLDWHGTEFESKEFEAQEKKISDFYMSKVVS